MSKNEKTFVKKKSQYSISKILWKKSHSIVYRKFREKDAIVQYVENVRQNKVIRYSTSKIS